jgi:hypothetical protein
LAKIFCLFVFIDFFVFLDYVGKTAELPLIADILRGSNRTGAAEPVPAMTVFGALLWFWLPITKDADRRPGTSTHGSSANLTARRARLWLTWF